MTELSVANVFARALKITAVVLFLAFGTHAQAQTPEPRQDVAADDTPTIFDVRKSLPMEPTEVAYHDFYINAGVEVGFKKGQYLPVSRAIPVHDPVQNKQQGILTIPVGKVQVIHVERNMAVARLASELTDEERPTLEFEAIMIGDRVDMKGITTEAPKPTAKKKRKATATDVKTEVETAPVTAVVNVETVPAAAKSVETVQDATTPVKTDLKSESTAQPVPATAPQRVTQPVPPPTA